MAQTKEQLLEIAVGQRVAELLNLKFNTIGRTNTSWGTKSIQGLGACITRIIEEEQIRLSDHTSEPSKPEFKSALSEAHTALHLVLINRNHYTLNSQTEKAVIEAHKVASKVLYPELVGDD
ncbi:MAG TPA: hypothetical protein PLJ08_22620 [Cyclobacteriaceae bacterium]|nr:hypothetical protein [Cyclobacteriaceae bacterium]